MRAKWTIARRNGHRDLPRRREILADVEFGILAADEDGELAFLAPSIRLRRLVAAAQARVVLLGIGGRSGGILLRSFRYVRLRRFGLRCIWLGCLRAGFGGLLRSLDASRVSGRGVGCRLYGCFDLNRFGFARRYADGFLSCGRVCRCVIRTYYTGLAGGCIRQHGPCRRSVGAGVGGTRLVALCGIVVVTDGGT